MALADQTANSGSEAFLPPGPAIGIVRPQGQLLQHRDHFVRTVKRASPGEQSGGTARTFDPEELKKIGHDG